jgi:hypothetical protein
LDNEESIDNNINEKWENIKKRIKEAKQQLIEKDEGTETFKNKWYNEECKSAKNLVFNDRKIMTYDMQFMVGSGVLHAVIYISCRRGLAE